MSRHGRHNIVTNHRRLFSIRAIRASICVIRDPNLLILDSKGVTLVELLVAMAIASILMLGLIAAFRTVQRSAAIGEAREQIYQNARVALDLVSKEVKNAHIDNRNRDLVLVSADGLNSRDSSILEYRETTPGSGVYEVKFRGLGNAQTPHGIDPTGAIASPSVRPDNVLFRLYADKTFGDVYNAMYSVKAINEIYTISPGPPDRLDFTCLTGNLPTKDEFYKPLSANESRLAEVRYIITTESFIDNIDNDHDKLLHLNPGLYDVWELRGTDQRDNIPPGEADIVATTGLPGVGDMVPMDAHYLSQDFRQDPNTGKWTIRALNLFQLRRAIQTYTDKNPFSRYDIPTWNGIDTPEDPEPNPRDPYGRYPDRGFGNPTTGVGDWLSQNNGENIGTYIYDLQFEFYGKIAVALRVQDPGDPEIWGVGWGNQDVRGEDIGTDCGGELTQDDDKRAHAIQYGKVDVAVGSTLVNSNASNPVSWPSTADKLKGGIFVIWPTTPPTGYTLDISDPANDVYTIMASTSTQLTLNRPYAGATASGANYRIIEPTQANGILDAGEDVGIDGLVGDPLDSILDDGSTGPTIGIPNNVSDNDGVTNESSIGEGNRRLDSRVMGIWDSRSPDPRNPRRASELNGRDDDGDAYILQQNNDDDDRDGTIDDQLATYLDKDGVSHPGPKGATFPEHATPEVDDPTTTPPTGADESNDLIDNDTGGVTDRIVDDRFYEPAGKPEGVDEPDEADPSDDTLPKAVRITVAVRDAQQSLEPIVLSTIVWLSTAK